MRLYHVSEEQDIAVFHPRKPVRTDMNQETGLVWAINERCLPNFLTPRDCPRVAWHVGDNTQPADSARYFSSSQCSHGIAIESRWFDRMRSATLYLYEFVASDFSLQDEIAGYYVSMTAQTPVQKIVISDVFAELLRRDVEVRIVNNLWKLYDELQETTVHWSMCRMRNALPRV